MSGPGPGEGIRASIASVRARARLVLALRGGSLAAAAAAAAILALIAAEILFRPSLEVRALLLAAAGLATALGISRALVRPLSAPLPDSAVASMLEREFPFLSFALVTSVDLAARPAPGTDPAFREAADEEAFAGLGRTNPREAVKTARAFRAAAFAGAFLAAFALFAVLDPRAALAFRRAVLLQEVPWPSRTRIRVHPSGSPTVARGDDLSVDAAFSGAVPARARLWVREAGDRAVETLEVSKDGRARRTFHAISRPFEFSIEGGDARSPVTLVRVRDRPSVLEISFRVEPPPHTGLAPSEIGASADRIRAPAGSVIRIRGRASRPIGNGSLSGARARAPLSIRGDSFEGAWRLLESERVEIHVEDADGLAAKPSPSALLEAVPDLAPRATVSVPLREGVLSPRAVLPITAVAEDDHGVTALGIRIERLPGGVSPAAAFERRAPGPAPPHPKRLPFLAEFPVAETGAEPGDVVRIVAEATDNDAFPKPKTGTSPVRAFDVLEPGRVEALLERRVLAFQEGLDRRLSALEAARAVSAKAPSAAAAALSALARDLAGRTRSLEAAARPLGEDLESAISEMEIQRAGIPERRAVLRTEALGPFLETVSKDLPALALLWDRAGLAPDAPAAIAAARAAEDRLSARWRAILAVLKSHSTFQEVVRTVRDMVDEQKKIREKTAADSEDRLDRLLGPKK